MSYPKIREIFDRASQYKDVISLGIGEPDFDTDETILTQGFRSVKEKRATHYSPVAGYMELREAVAHKYWTENQLKVDREEVMITHGAQHALMITLMSLLNPGDEILVPDPYYPSYLSQILLCGATPVFIPTLEEEGFKPTIKNIRKRISAKSKLLILNTPNNPTGAVLEREVLEEIATLVIKNDLMVIADEAYETMVYDEKRHYCIASIPGMKERTITINSFSKRYAMTGWRVGYAVGPREIVAHLMKLGGYHLSCPCSISQQAALAALKSPPDIMSKMHVEYNLRRNFMVHELNKISGISCNMPEGAFYIFANIKKTGKTSEQFYDELLTRARVVVIPGSAFGQQGEGYIRIAYTLPIERLQEALERIKGTIG